MASNHRDQFDIKADRNAAHAALQRWSDDSMCLFELDRVIDKKTGRVYIAYSIIEFKDDTGYIVMRRDRSDQPRVLAVSNGAAPRSYLADIKRDMKWHRRDLRDAK